MQLLGVIQDKNYQSYIDAGLTGFLFPLERLSCDYTITYTLEEVKEFKKNYPSVLCFVVINQMIFQKDIILLTKMLEELEKIKIDGVLFYDVSIIQLIKEKNINIPLFLHQTHFVTNAQMINTYQKHGIKGAYISNEITEEEILQICDKTSVSLIMLLVGYPTVAMSKRKLISHYLKEQPGIVKTLNIIEPSSKQMYHLQETEAGTTFKYGKRLNHSCSYEKLKDKITYGVIEQDDLDTQTYQTLISAYRKNNLKQIDQIAGHNRGFLYRKTIYRVKKK